MGIKRTDCTNLAKDWEEWRSVIAVLKVHHIFGAALDRLDRRNDPWKRTVLSYLEKDTRISKPRAAAARKREKP